MKTVLKSLMLTAAMVLPLFWFTVAPRGADLCKSNEEFNYHPLDDAGHEAGRQAKRDFCKVVSQLAH